MTRQHAHHLIKTGSLRARKAGQKWLVSAAPARCLKCRSDDLERDPDGMEAIYD